MTTRVTRKIINIDESKCNGCGECIDSCLEGALALVDGKARLVKEKYCDGLAACLKECPQGALSIVERESEDFDEEATQEHLQEMKNKNDACSCPGSAVRQFEKVENSEKEAVKQTSRLSHWPVQLTLVPAGAPFLKNADVVFLADCVPVAYPDLHRDFLKDHAVLVACPKLDDFEAHLAKLTAILKQAEIKSLTVVHMEVPCCSGLVYMARQAIARSGKNIPLKEVIISIRGTLKSETGV
jgi:Fe-S-cluster-containing hydrogenase component 2